MHTQTKGFFSKKSLSILIVSTLICAFISQPVFATPADDLASLSKEQESLDAELSKLAEDIHEVQAEKETCAAELKKAQSVVDNHYASMKERIRYMYEEGDIGMLNIMFSSDSMADFINNVYYVSTINDYDRKMLDEYEAAKLTVTKKQDELAAREQELKELQDDRLAKQEELADEIAQALADMAAAQGVQATVTAAADGTYTLSTAAGDFTWNGSVLTRAGGVNWGPTGKETYYNMNMSGVIQIMRAMGNNDQYWVRSDGVKMLGDYVIVGANLSNHPRGSIVETSLGKGIVCDTGYVSGDHLDIATSW